MTLEKHNMLYAVQFTLHEFDETGSVSRRTMEMLGARAILLRYEIEAELADAVVKNKAKEKPKEEQLDIVFTPEEGLDIQFEPETQIKRKNGRKNCKQCKTKLVGKQRLFCSDKCARRNWKVNNRETARIHQRSYLERKKNRQKLTLVK